MLNRILKMPQVLKNQGFWIWHVCMYKGYVEFRLFLIMAPYGSIMPRYASICLNVPQYAWTWLNIVECLWIGQKMPAGTVLTKSATRKFSAQGRLCGIRALWEAFRQKKKKKEATQAKILELFLLDTHKTTFWMEDSS